MCVTHLLSHAPCGHLTTSLPASLAGHCKALNAALRYYHSQRDRPPMPGGMMMPRVCAESRPSYFWPVTWGCGRGEDVLCRLGWGEVSCPWATGKAPRARKIRDGKSKAGSSRVSANINSNLKDNSVTSPMLEPGPAPLDPQRNLTPTPPINLNSKKSTETTNPNPQEAQFWGWGYWIDRQTNQIAPPPSVAANTAAPLLVATATREKSSPTQPINLGLKKSTEINNLNPQEAQFWGWGCWIDRQTGKIAPPPPVAARTAASPSVATAMREKISLGKKIQVRVIWPGRCIVDGDVGDFYCAMS